MSPKSTKRDKGNKAGRPAVPVDLNQVSELAQLGCSEADIAAVLGMSQRTFQRKKKASKKIGEAIEIGHGKMRFQLRMYQLQAAKKLNPALLIWLGKNHLGQSDKIEMKTDALPKGFSISRKPDKKPPEKAKKAEGKK